MAEIQIWRRPAVQSGASTCCSSPSVALEWPEWDEGSPLVCMHREHQTVCHKVKGDTARAGASRPPGFPFMFQQTGLALEPAAAVHGDLWMIRQCGGGISVQRLPGS